MDKKRVALMTWYHYRNYGTALQASALTQIITALGYEVNMINYVPRKKPIVASKQSLRIFAQKIYSACKKRLTKNFFYNPLEKERLFASYLSKRIKETQPCVSYPELYDLNDKFDAFICGSDQIWSPLCFEEQYFLPFIKNENKLIAYAPSFGVTKIENAQIKSKMKSLISRFNWLSSREQNGVQFIKELTNRTAELVLDPTLLLTALEWDEYAKLSLDVQEEYILCYFLGDERKYFKKVRQIAKLSNKKIYLIPTTRKQAKNKYAIDFCAGPSEFISLIKNASYVCTDSFHGLCFSIIYNKPFSIFERFSNKDFNSQNSRIFSLLDILQAKDRLCKANTAITNKIFDFNFEKINGILAQKREESLQFLRAALSCATKQNLSNETFTITDTCCGCGTCATVCSKGAISIKVNEDGFYHYAIDQTKCVKCGQCKTVCPMVNILAPSLKDAKALCAVKSTSNSILKSSSSGGIGYELGGKLLKKGYIVFGCTYDKSKNIAKHIAIYPNEPEKLRYIQGSKYIQSMTETALSQISRIAKDNKIAFFGTPCQVAGVDKLLRKQGVRENAILIDLICHGVPSYHLFNKYLGTVHQKKGISLQPDVTFRVKKNNWQNRYIKIYDEKKEYTCSERKDHFYAFFRRGLCDMPTCYECPYRERSSADARLGDYWGNKYRKSKLGVSMVIANTRQGMHILEELDKEGAIYVENNNLDDYWTIQAPYNRLKPLWRETLIEDLKNDRKSLRVLRKEYCRNYDIFEKMQRIFMGMKRFFKK